MKKVNIITKWLQLRGGSKAASVRYLNSKLGMQYTQSRLLEWEKGKLPIPAHVRQLLVAETLPTILEENGILATEAMQQAIIDAAFG